MSIPALETDFNEVFDEECVCVSVRRSLEGQQVQPGDWVRLYDEDGLSCWASVTERSGPNLTCRIEPSSWRWIRFNLDKA